MSDDLKCCPEWCDPTEREGERHHGPVCPESQFHPDGDYTKAQFVMGAVANTGASIDSYLLWLEDGVSHHEARENAMREADEIATCFAGIGSCGRGWCHHG